MSIYAQWVAISALGLSTACALTGAGGGPPDSITLPALRYLLQNASWEGRYLNVNVTKLDKELYREMSRVDGEGSCNVDQSCMFEAWWKWRDDGPTGKLCPSWWINPSHGVV